MKKIVTLLLCMMLLVGLCFALASCQCKHEYGDPVVTEATCTEDGKNTYTCTKCGEVKEETPEDLKATGHSADDGTITTPPACLVDGLKTFKCTVCDAVTGAEAVPATGHDYVPHKDADTHSELCSICGDAKVEETAHTYGDPVTVTPVSCTEDGSATKTCTVCGYVATVVVPATGHTVSGDDVVTQPTAGNCLPGMTYKVCSTCEEKVVTEWRPSDVAHSFVVDTSAVNNEEDHSAAHSGGIGKIAYKCEDCEITYVVDATYVWDFNNDCACGYNYQPAVINPEASIITDYTTNDYLSIIGAFNDVNMNNNMQIYAANTDQLLGKTSIVFGWSVSMPEAGLPEVGIELISKLDGWKNPKATLKLEADGTIKVGGEAVGALVAGEFTDIVVSYEIAQEAGADSKYAVAVNYWIDGEWIATTETEALTTNTFSGDGGSLYIQWKIAKTTNANADVNRGVLIDNAFVADELPAGFVTSVLPKHTCEAEAGAALQYDEDGHYNVCKTCGEPMNVTPHTLGTAQTVAPVAGNCAPGMTFQACDCGYKKISATTPSDTPHKFEVDTSKLSAVDHTAADHAAAGKITYTCTECDMSYTVDTVAAITFDECVCGFNYDAGTAIYPEDKVADGFTPVEVTTDGALSIIGMISKTGDENNDGKIDANDKSGAVGNNIDMRYVGASSLVSGKLTNAQFAAFGFSITMPEAGFPATGMDLNLKYAGAWVNSGLSFKNAAVNFNGKSVPVVAGEYVNVVVTIDATTAGKVIWNVWVDGLWLGAVEKADAAITETKTFDNDGNTYGNITINGNNTTNTDPAQGVIIDNMFWADAIPEGFVDEVYVAPAPAPAA